MAEDYEKIKQAGAELVAISVDDPSYAWSMAQTTGATFQILSDVDHKVIKQYGILNSQEHGGIAFPSTFIVDKTGRIRWLHVGKDPSDRPPDKKIIDEVRKVAEPG